jgi:CRISPR-associated endonuclease/helicase Cas3
MANVFALVAEPVFWRMWAKWPRSRSVRRYHPVICHLLDVASVARLMWFRALTIAQRKRIADELRVSEDEAGRWVAFWAGLHDLGKVSPSFQTQLADAPDGPLIAGWLSEAGLPTSGAQWAPHGGVSLILIEDTLPRLFRYSDALASRVACIVGAHHGLFFTKLQLEELNKLSLIGDERLWGQAQDAHVRALAAACEVSTYGPQGDLRPGSAMTLAGLISAADWVGSNVGDFPLAADIAPSPRPLDLAAYIHTTRRQAEQSLTRVAWDHPDFTGQRRTFAQLFPTIKRPRQLQETVIEIAELLTSPGLVIVEAPMGEGKTEAAMYLADHWSVRLGQRGVYFALPTQATSNQMFRRVRQFLSQRLTSGMFVNLHLAHGMAALAPDYEALRRQVAPIAEASLYDQTEPGRIGQKENAGRGAVIAAEWFAASKRTLLSSYGVGTTDQSLLAALQVKHMFVRLFGLSGKTVIVDEVHAYDVYMSTLLERTLEWLGALGAPVVLLSATLPAGRRRELLKSYARGAGWPAPQIEAALYPRVTYLSESQAGSQHVPATTQARHLALRWVNGALPQDVDAPFPLAEEVFAALRDGGCAAIVCTTVRRAQQMYTALERACARLPDQERPTLHLLHAQYTQQERAEREDFVLSALGPGDDEQRNRLRPFRSIVVATQVIEQSLDLDFDLMVSDLAPLDLLLQRSGRLHRHEKDDPARPQRLKRPTLWICEPVEGEDLVPDIDSADDFVYGEYILLRTWHVLQARTQDQQAGIAIPDEIEELIEAVYDESESALAGVTQAFAERLEKARRIANRKVSDSEGRAKLCRILPPWDEKVFYDFSRQLDEDNPEAHATIQAQTRDGDPRLPVVLLDAHAAAIFNPSAVPGLEEARTLLGRSVNLSRKGLVNALLKESVPSGWAQTPWLRNHRVIRLDANGGATIGAGKHVYRLTLDPMLGVIVEWHGKGA